MLKLSYSKKYLSQFFIKITIYSISFSARMYGLHRATKKKRETGLRGNMLKLSEKYFDLIISTLTSSQAIRHWKTTELQPLGWLTSHRLLLLWQQSYAGLPVVFLSRYAQPRLIYFLLHFRLHHVQSHNVRNSLSRIDIVISKRDGKLFLHQTRVIARNTCLNSLLK